MNRNPNEDYFYTIKRYFKENWRMLLMGTALLCGMAIGALLIRNRSVMNLTDIENTFHNFFTQRSTQNFFHTFLYSLWTSFPLLLVTYCCGFFALGAPFTVMLPLYKGLGLGVISGYLYAYHGLKGVAFSALLLLPGHFLSTLILI